MENDSKSVSFIALLIWLLSCHIFQLWMLPAAGLGILTVQFINGRELEETDNLTTPTDIVSTKDPLQEDVFVRVQTMDIFDRLQTVPDITQSVQTALGKVASIMERTKK